jgi:hypothetical protein
MDFLDYLIIGVIRRKQRKVHELLIIRNISPNSSSNRIFYITTILSKYTEKIFQNVLI